MRAELSDSLASDQEGASVLRAGLHLPEPQGLLGLREQLEVADWSLAVLDPLLPVLIELADTLQPSERYDWQVGLRLAWLSEGRETSARVRRQLLALAYEWDDWPLVVEVGQPIVDEHGEDADVVTKLAEAQWHLGDVTGALSLLRPVLMGQPGNSSAYALYRAIDAWADYRIGYPLTAGAVSNDGQLWLEPLGEHHLRDFAWQYHDPSIAELCCLPQFGGDAQWLDWLREVHGYGDQLLFAVMHRDWGFVGSVSLILHRGVGFFYFWVGSGYQGNGIGPDAVSLMLGVAQAQLGMHACYAKAFADNYPSRRGLIKLGFSPMAVKPAPPHDMERFYRLGQTVDDGEEARELAKLLDDIGSDVCVYRAPGPASVGSATTVSKGHPRPGTRESGCRE